MDGYIDVQHDHRPRRTNLAGQMAVGRRQDLSWTRFPNLFIMSGPQGGGGQFNFTRGIEAHTDYVTWMLETLRGQGTGIVDIRKERENAYAQHCREADIRTRALRDCLSYYNGDGAAEPGSLAYYGGPQKWHEL